MTSLLFHTSSYTYMADALAQAGGYEMGEIERKIFPDGERYLRLVTAAWGRDVVLLGGTPHDADCLEVYDLGHAIARAGARSLSLVIPYLGYATMERATRPGEVVTAYTRARLLRRERRDRGDPRAHGRAALCVGRDRRGAREVGAEPGA
jgi:ribose-phosphate pyrophosphokinase